MNYITLKSKKPRSSKSLRVNVYPDGTMVRGDVNADLATKMSVKDVMETLGMTREEVLRARKDARKKEKSLKEQMKEKINEGVPSDLIHTFDRKFLRTPMYKRALNDLIAFMKRPKTSVHHDVYFYASKIASKYAGMDYRELVRFYQEYQKNEDINIINRTNGTPEMEIKEQSSMIDQLRSAYGKLKKIDPASDTYKRLISILDKADEKTLKALVSADINFVTPLARNRLVRKGMNESLSVGTKVRVPHRGKTVTGKIVRYSKADDFYVVDVGEIESIKVPVHKIQESKEHKKLISRFDQVRIKSTKETGVVYSISGLKAEVRTSTKLVNVDVKDLESLSESKSDYKLYHKTYSDAVQHAVSVANKRGYEVDEDDWFNKVTTGPKKPSSGKTNSVAIALTKAGKPVRQKLQMQVYNMDNKSYELNMYIESTQVPPSADGDDALKDEDDTKNPYVDNPKDERIGSRDIKKYHERNKKVIDRPDASKQDGSDFVKKAKEPKTFKEFVSTIQKNSMNESLAGWNESLLMESKEDIITQLCQSLANDGKTPIHFPKGQPKKLPVKEIQNILKAWGKMNNHGRETLLSMLDSYERYRKFISTNESFDDTRAMAKHLEESSAGLGKGAKWYPSSGKPTDRNYYAIGGDRYDGGVVFDVFVNGKKVHSEILDGEADYIFKGKRYGNVDSALDAIAKANGLNSHKDFQRYQYKD